MISESSFYKLMFVYHVYVVIYRQLYPMVNKDDTHFGGDWKYLTHWNAMIQILYYLSNGVLLFIPRWKEKTSRILHHVFSCVVFPLAGFVTVMFWSLYAISPRLVIDPNAVYQETAWLNHMKHTLVLVWAVSELIIVNHSYPPSLIGGVTAAAVSGIYMVWVHVVYFVDSFWVYPILENFGLVPRVLFCGAIVGFYQVLYLIGRVVNCNVHRDKARSNKEYAFDAV